MVYLYHSACDLFNFLLIILDRPRLLYSCRELRRILLLDFKVECRQIQGHLSGKSKTNGMVKSYSDTIQGRASEVVETLALVVAPTRTPMATTAFVAPHLDKAVMTPRTPSTMQGGLIKVKRLGGGAVSLREKCNKFHQK